MSGSDSPTFFHGQPWSNWIEKIGRDKPLSDEEQELDFTSAVMRLSVDDIDLYGFCPERDLFYGVVCEICNAIVKPQALIQHMESRHPSGLTNLTSSVTPSTKPLKTPYCKLSKLKRGQTENLSVQTSLAGTTQVTASSPVRSPNEGGSQKRKRLKADRSLLKDREYDPDKHCGVWNDETGKPCTRSLTCKAHTVSLRRAVTGRSKTFDILLAEHRATKEPSNSKAAKINFQSTVNVTTDASNASQMTTISTNSTSSEVDAPRSPPVLSLPDTFPLPQVVDMLYQCLAPHGSNKSTKLQEDFASELDPERIDSTPSNTATGSSNLGGATMSLVLPSVSPVSNITSASSILQYNKNSSPLTVEQLMSIKHSPAAPVVPSVLPVNQAIVSTSVLEGKTPIDIDAGSITMFSPVYDSKSQVAVQISRANMISHCQSQPTIVNLNLFNAVDSTDMRNNLMSNGKRGNMERQSGGRIKNENLIQVEATAASAAFTNFNEISWSSCHPEPLAVNRWLRITSNRKQYNFNIH